MNIVTDPNEYVLRTASWCPIRYADTTFDAVKLRVLDTLFNVTGNGIRDHQELLQCLTVAEFDRDLALRCCNGEPVYFGYTQTLKFVEADFQKEFPQGDPIMVLEDDRPNHPEIVYWMKNKRFEWNPYPNFNKQYSIVWRSNFRELGPAWSEAAVWFYTKCDEWFDNHSSKYSYAYPHHDEQQTRKYLDGMIKNRTQYDSDQAFAEAYGAESFDGNMDQFFRQKWQRELKRIREYIQETITEFSK